MIYGHNNSCNILSGGNLIMKKALAIFMVAAFAVAAIVMYFYWQRDTDIVNKGVLISSELRLERIYER